jgi:hypothetical protein
MSRRQRSYKSNSIPSIIRGDFYFQKSEGAEMYQRKEGIKLSTISSEPFGCCNFFSECDYGRRGCVHEEYDPEYAQLCASFKRASQRRKQDSQKDQVDLFFEENGQASFF